MNARRLFAGLLLLASCAAESGAPAARTVFTIEDPWPDLRALPRPTGPLVIVTNSRDDTVSLFDAAAIGTPDFKELARVPVGLNPVELEGPHHAALDPRGEFYYVGISNFVPGSGSGPHGAHGTGTADGYALKFRASDHALVGSARVDPNPGDLKVSPDGKTLYLTHFDLVRLTRVAQRNGPEAEMNARLAVVDAETMTRKMMVTLCPAPHGMKLSKDGRALFVACYSDELAVVKLDDPAYPVKRIKVAPDAGGATTTAHEPYGLTLAPNGEVWVSCLKARDAHVFQPSTEAFDHTRLVRLPGPPLFGDFSADGSVLYLPYQRGDRVAMIDPATGQSKGEIAVRGGGCTNVHQVELAPDGRHALVVCEGNQREPGSLLVLDLMNGGQMVNNVPVGVFPDFVGILEAAPR